MFDGSPRAKKKRILTSLTKKNAASFLLDWDLWENDISTIASVNLRGEKRIEVNVSDWLTLNIVKELRSIGRCDDKSDEKQRNEENRFDANEMHVAWSMNGNWMPCLKSFALLYCSLDHSENRRWKQENHCHRHLSGTFVQLALSFFSMGLTCCVCVHSHRDWQKRESLSFSADAI